MCIVELKKWTSVRPCDEGLLEYLEDIIGTNQYVEHIELKAKSLEELNEKRGTQVNRLKLVEKERDALDGAKQEAEKYMAKERELLKTRSILYQLFVQETQTNVNKIAASKAELDQKLEHERAKYSEHQDKVTALEAAHKQHAAALGKLRGELDKASKEFAEFERKDIKHREDLKNMKARAKKLDDKVGKDTAKQGEMAAECAAIEEEVPALEAKKVELEDRVVKEEAALDTLMESLKDEMAKIGAELYAAQAEMSPWEGKIADAKARVDVATAERTLLTTAREEATRRLSEARAGVTAAEATAAAKTEEISDAEATLEGERARATERREAEAAARTQESAATEVTREIRGRLELRRSAADAERSQGVIVQALMAAKAKGKIKGVLGRLGDLGAIDRKYDVAVSTACSALDYIVVETTADAQACVTHLRANNLGRAVQVYTLKPTLKSAGTKRLKLKYDNLLTNSAVKSNLRRYTWAWPPSSSWRSSCTCSTRWPSRRGARPRSPARRRGSSTSSSPRSRAWPWPSTTACARPPWRTTSTPRPRSRTRGGSGGAW